MDYSFMARSPIAVVITAIAVGVSYLLGLAFYRLALHPLSRFPGPKLAALTKWSVTFFESFPVVAHSRSFLNHLSEEIR